MKYFIFSWKYIARPIKWKEITQGIQKCHQKRFSTYPVNFMCKIWWKIANFGFFSKNAWWNIFLMDGSWFLHARNIPNWRKTYSYPKNDLAVTRIHSVHYCTGNSKQIDILGAERETLFVWLLLFSCALRDSRHRYVGLLVSWLVGPFYFFGVSELFEHTAPAQMPKWPSTALLLPTRMQLG